MTTYFIYNLFVLEDLLQEQIDSSIYTYLQRQKMHTLISKGRKEKSGVAIRYR